MISEYTFQRAESLNQLNIPEIEIPVGIRFLWFDIVTSSNITKRIYTGVHAHSFFELQFVYAGRVNYECESSNIELSKGQALLIPPDIPHKYLGCDDGLLKGSIAFSVEKNDFYTSGEVRKFNFSTDVAQNTDFVLKQCECKNIFTPAIICGRMLEILYSVCKTMEIIIPEYTDKEYDSRVLFAKKYIDDNKNRLISCEDVAKVCGLSSKQLSRIFKNNIGCSLFEYIINFRLKYAKKLLKNEEYSIKEVGYMLGFASESGFVSFFKRNCKIPPGVYRKDLIMSEN